MGTEILTWVSKSGLTIYFNSWTENNCFLLYINISVAYLYFICKLSVSNLYLNKKIITKKFPSFFFFSGPWDLAVESKFLVMKTVLPDENGGHCSGQAGLVKCHVPQLNVVKGPKIKFDIPFYLKSEQCPCGCIKIQSTDFTEMCLFYSKIKAFLF